MNLIIDIILHMDTYLASWAVQYGMLIYVLMFLVIFIETGFIVMPFLPGDSLLFALGAMTTLGAEAMAQANGGTLIEARSLATGEGLNIYILMFSLMFAAIVGDNVNYNIGRLIGPKVFNKEDSWLFHKNHLQRTKDFYEKYGAKAIVLARFVPIVRTFVPFVAGVGEMDRKKFMFNNILGGVLWINIFLWAGRIFGNLPVVKRNFHVVIFAVIGVSVLPILIEWLKSRRRTKVVV